MTCKYLKCKTTRPLTAYEEEMGWHVPCLNHKHKSDRTMPRYKSDATMAKEAEYGKKYYRRVTKAGK